jgi:hypothetical protein
MAQNPNDVTNPGSVNAGSEAFGVGPIAPNQPVTRGPGTNPGPLVQGLASAPGLGVDSPDQPVIVSPSSNAGPLAQAGSYAPGLGTDSPDQPVTVGPSQNSGQLVQGGTASPTSPNCENTTENTVVNQIYGTGSPRNVFV